MSSYANALYQVSFGIYQGGWGMCQFSILNTKMKTRAYLRGLGRGRVWAAPYNDEMILECCKMLERLLGHNVSCHRILNSVNMSQGVGFSYASKFRKMARIDTTYDPMNICDRGRQASLRKSLGKTDRIFVYILFLMADALECVNAWAWASYQIRKIAGCACAGNAGNVFPRRRFQRKPLVSDPDMHHGTCVTHVPWCMSGSLTCGDGENVPGIPACASTNLRIWQEAHEVSILRSQEFVRLQFCD